MKPEFKAKGIREAAQALTRLNLSEEERYAYDRYMGDVRISLSTLDSAFSDGKAEGKAEGIAEEKTKIVFNMHRLGLSTKQISEFVELSEKKVQGMLAAQKK